MMSEKNSLERPLSTLCPSPWVSFPSPSFGFHVCVDAATCADTRHNDACRHDHAPQEPDAYAAEDCSGGDFAWNHTVSNCT